MQGFDFCLPPEPDVLADLRRALIDWLRQAEISERDRASIVLATHEAAANAIEHADSHEPVQVRAQLAKGLVTVEVMDRGRWEPQAASGHDRGRGLQLIEDLVFELQIEKDPRGTTLRLLCRI